jgi:hypothetical protein
MADESKVNNPFEGTIAFCLTFNRVGCSRKVSPELVQTDAERRLLRISKRILACEETRELSGMDDALRAFVRSKSVPHPFMKGGIHLVPIDNVEAVDAEVERVKPLRAEVARRLAGRVEELKERDREALGTLFVEGEYPTADEVLAECSIETQYMTPMETPGKLSEVSKAIFDRERQRAQGKLQEASEAIRQVQRLQLADLVGALADRLAPNPDGRKRVIRQGGPLDQVREFLEQYGRLNVTNDAELAEVVKRAQAILSGVDLEALRTNEALAERVKNGLDAVKTVLEPMIENAPRRKLRETA